MLYIIQNTETFSVKIGYSDTKEGCYKRLRSHQVGNESKLKIVRIWEGTESDESDIHHRLWQSHKKGEWFNWDKPVIEFVINGVLPELKHYKNPTRGYRFYGNEENDNIDYFKMVICEYQAFVKKMKMIGVLSES